MVAMSESDKRNWKRNSYGGCPFCVLKAKESEVDRREQ